jgi:hypothetical protein
MLIEWVRILQWSILGNFHVSVTEMLVLAKWTGEVRIKASITKKGAHDPQKDA